MGGIGIDGVGKAELFPHALEEAGAHAAAQNHIQHLQGGKIGAVARNGGKGNGEVRLLDGLLFEQRVRAAHDVLFALRELLPRHPAEFALCKRFCLLGLDVARKGDDDVLGAVALLLIGKELLAREALYVLRRAQDVSPVVFIPERGTR